MLSLGEFVEGFDNIHLLSIEGSYEELRSCLHQDPGAAHRHNENGLLPIHQVIQRDYDDTLEVIDLVLAYNADVNARTVVEADTALHLTVRNVRAQKANTIVRKLIHHGANPRIRNNKGHTAYDEAMARGYVDLADLLNSDRWIRDRHALVTAVCSGTISDINRCFRLGVDVDKKTEIGAAPIHYTITHRLYPNRLAVLKILVKNNVNVTAKNRQGDTALHLAVRELDHDDDMIDIIKYLLSVGINVEVRNKSQDTAEDIALEYEYQDVVEILRGRRGNDNDKPVRKYVHAPKWFKAVEASRTDDIRRFGKESGDKRQIYNEEGLTPLHVCVDAPYHKEQTRMIPALLVAGVDINAQTRDEGNTALHLTAMHNNYLAAELLLKHNINTKTKNKRGQTAIDICDKLFHKKVKVLIMAKEKGSKSCQIL